MSTAMDFELERLLAEPRLPLVHRYPGKGRPPEPGDVAWCGFVKRAPHDAEIALSGPACVVCESLRSGLPKRVWPTPVAAASERNLGPQGQKNPLGDS